MFAYIQIVLCETLIQIQFRFISTVDHSHNIIQTQNLAPAFLQLTEKPEEGFKWTSYVILYE